MKCVSYGYGDIVIHKKESSVDTSQFFFARHCANCKKSTFKHKGTDFQGKGCKSSLDLSWMNQDKHH